MTQTLTASRKPKAPASTGADLETADYVDHFVMEWDRHRPDLQIHRLSPLMRVLRLSNLLEKELSRIAKMQDITSAQFQVLAALRRHDPEPQSLSQLSRIAILTSGSMTSLVDRLEERQFVRRQRHPEDRRGILLALTDAGRNVIDAALEMRVRRLHALADSLSAQDLSAISTGLRKLLLAVDTPFEGNPS
ncbi:MULTISPECIES: MarR family winged helix-turn-helix transcriptional regulator [unclassified Variovorax]|uniref:MarR family winged helix-turn-helix transcriptional regulator n=1 Tax=unclassified Variovorax TaxID=663243 RepID=UPI003F45E840